ncbi:MAG: DNA methyltransferase [Thermoproteota archaeon]
MKLEVQKSPKRVNKLNDLTGTEWIKFTKTWFIHRPAPRENAKLLHPAAFPESLVKEFIEFFTKKGELVLDPFLGTGSTLLACIESNRSGVGIEVVRKWAVIAQSRVDKMLAQKRGSEQFLESMGLTSQKLLIKVIHGDSRYLSRIWEENRLPPAAYCITSPPYWNQLKRNYIRQKERVTKGLETKYSEDPADIGNIDDYDDFLQAIKNIFNEVYKVTKNMGYLTVVTNNVFFDGRVYPLAFDTVKILSEKPCPWVPKDEKIWLQDDKPLLPLGIYNAWIGNRAHQYCLILRKEE